MRPQETNGRTGARHEESHAAVGCKGRKADLIEIDDERLGDSVRAGWEANRASLGVDQVLNRGSVVGLPVAPGPVVEDGDEAAAFLDDAAGGDGFAGVLLLGLFIARGSEENGNGASEDRGNGEEGAFHL